MGQKRQDSASFGASWQGIPVEREGVILPSEESDSSNDVSDGTWAGRLSNESADSDDDDSSSGASSDSEDDDDDSGSEDGESGEQEDDGQDEEGLHVI